jgi:hypothetical protein
MTHIKKTAVECGRVIEARRIKANEVPVVIGALVVALSDHTGVPLPACLQMVTQAANTLATSKTTKSN